MTTDDAHLTRFLLGDLAPAEASMIEERFFSDNAFFEHICALEEELVRDYLKNRLPRSTKNKFEARLRCSPELRHKTESAKSIMNGLQGEARVASLPVRGWLAMNSAAVLATAAVLASVASTVWFANQNSRLQSHIRTLEVELRQKQQSPVILSFLLSPGNTKGDSAAAKRFFVPMAADVVHLRLEVAQWAQFERYRAALHAVDDQALVWSAELKPTGAAVVDCGIPGAVVRSEDYVLTLDGLSHGGDFQHLESYSFSIARR